MLPRKALIGPDDRYRGSRPGDAIAWVRLDDHACDLRAGEARLEIRPIEAHEEQSWGVRHRVARPYENDLSDFDIQPAWISQGHQGRAEHVKKRAQSGHDNESA
ncbi:MAG: hypothetical protein ABR549_06915 [Mycobacteriales bacterium]